MKMTLKLPHGEIMLPAFFPDATFAAVRCVDFQDVDDCGLQGLVMNSYHLLTKPGVSVLKRVGGLHTFTGWKKPILTDSGGFQVFSLIHENRKYGEVRKNEIIFRPDNEKKSKIIITPEKSIQSQFTYGSDVMMCIDYCTHPDDSYEVNQFSVKVTIDWASRCKKEYLKQLKLRNIPQEKRPLLFAVIQGGSFKDLRSKCADALLEIGFDGYGFGGWPVNSDGTLTDEILDYTASLMPDTTPKYAMGLGKPEDIVKCVNMGYNLFDCVIPTRDARHNRLYVFNSFDGLDYSYYYILDKIHITEDRPVSEHCDCFTCRHYSRAYLYHLMKSGDSSAYRLATIHNLKFYSDFFRRINVERDDFE